MDLDLALNSSRRLSPLVLPDLTRLIAAKKRVLERWPDIVPDPPERDHETIVTQMLALLQSNSWGDVKLSFVLRALKVAFSPNFRTREDVAQIIDFAFEELDTTTQPTFLNAMVAIYLSSYEPKADHSLDLGTRIVAKRHLLSGKWRAIEGYYPTLFDASRAHGDIAASMEDMEEPWLGLKANGFSNPHATGLLDYVHTAYINRIRPRLHSENWLNTLFTWLNPEPGKRKTTGSIDVIEAVLGHWARKSASDQTRQIVTEYLINQYNDPRINRSLWLGVGADYMSVIFSWLTREDLRFFTSVVDATQRDPQWQPRKKFWLKLYDEGKINEAWVAFCPSAERYARTHLIRSGYADNSRRFGRQSKGGTRSDTSILIMKIGNKIVVDGCHNYRTHIFNVDDPVAPKLYGKDYDCDADVMELAPWSKSHSSIPSWSQWVRDSIASKTPMSAAAVSRRSSFNEETTAPSPAPTQASSVVQSSVLGQHLPSVRSPWSPSSEQTGRGSPTASHSDQTRSLQSGSTSQPVGQSAVGQQPQTVSNTPKTSTGSRYAAGLAPFSGSAVDAEVKELRERMLHKSDKLWEIDHPLQKILERKELRSAEQTRITHAIRRHRVLDTEFQSLRVFLEPIFLRKMSPYETSLWAAKVNEIERIARARGLISPNVSSALKSLARREELGVSEKNAMEYMAQRLRHQGVELLEIIRKE